jgi:hypothetical protein
VDADVAVIDSGVDAEPDLNVVARTNCSKGGACIDGSGYDSTGHATHVAGTIGALDNSFGVVGMAPGVRIWSVKTHQNGSSESKVIAGIDWVTAHANRIEVASMSIGGPLAESAAMRGAFERMVEAGVVTVVAAGNSAVDANGFSPAKDPDVITVSALADYDGLAGGAASPTCNSYGSDDTSASFTNFGSTIEVAAPGVCILSTVPGGYEYKSGTSMATPHVSGAAAILASMSNPNSKADVEKIREQIIAAGNSNWTDNSGDGIKEPLLDVGSASTFGGLKAPTVTPKAATGVTSTKATLNGRIDPNGLSTSYRFEYGSTDKYGASAPAEPAGIGSGNGAVEVSQALSGLTSGVDYHFRVVATNSAGTTYGPDQTTGSVARWYACSEHSEAKYTNSECSKEASPGSWESLPTPAGSAVSVTASGKSFTFTTVRLGLALTLSCTPEVSGATLKNPSGSGNGTGNAEIKFSGCKAEGSGWTNCVVSSTSYPLQMALSVANGQSEVAFSPVEGKVLDKFTLSSCKAGSLNGTLNLEGPFSALFSNSLSQLEFTSATSKGLKLGEHEAGAAGTIGVTGAGSGRIKVEAPHPTVYTGQATEVKATEATLGATINPQGFNTSYQIEWTGEATYAHANAAPVKAESVGSGASEVAVSQTVGPLTPGATYHYRVVATGGPNAFYGADRTFTAGPNPQRWYACSEHSEAKYTNSECSKEASPGSWEWLPTPAGSAVSVTASGKSFTFTTTRFGLALTLTCTPEVSGATLKNPSGSGNGTGNAEIKFSACKAEGWSGCSVSSSSYPLQVALTTIEGKNEAALSPVEGKVLDKFTFTGCSFGSLNGTYNLEGPFTAPFSNALSQLEFSSATSKGLTFGGLNVGAAGTIGLTAAGGGYIRVE